MRLQAPYHDNKIAVETVNVYEDRIECEVYTLGMPSSQEPDTFSRVVSMDDVRKAVCFNGRVDITDAIDSAVTTTVSFEEWLSDAGSEEIADVCAGIINKAEGRTTLCKPASIPQLPGGELFGNLSKVA